MAQNNADQTAQDQIDLQQSRRENQGLREKLAEAERETDQKFAEYKTLIDGSNSMAKRLLGETDLMIMDQSEKHETELKMYGGRIESLKRDHEG